MLRSIGGRSIGRHVPVFVIAELGLNHGGSVERALAMVDGAARAGASAIKLQTLYADRLVAPACPPPAHVRAASLREFFAAFELTLDAHRAIVARARSRGLAVMTTPFAADVVPALERLGFDAYKIASGDLTYDGLVAAVGRTRRPVVLSTGMATVDEVRHAVRVAQRAGCGELAVLQCTSAYPAPPASENLRAIATLSAELALPVGLSDHGGGLASAAAAVALGACIYERHLVLEGDATAIDAPVSSTPVELAAIVAAMEHVRVALGDGAKRCHAAEAANAAASRRGLYAARALRAGERIGEGDVAVLRPQSALKPSQAPALIGSTLGRDVAAGEPFVAADLACVRVA
jgi:sialic acid synthase SpsE